VLVPRTIDKIRATLPGGDLGPYHVAIGLSHTLLTIIGVTLDDLRDAVIAAGSDGDVAAWLRHNADTSQYERANSALSTFRHENIAAEHRAHFESLYPDYLRSRYAVAFDLIDADDRELYPVLGQMVGIHPIPGRPEIS
jgi:hypothetical protein